MEHIRLGAVAQLADAEAALETASLREGVTSMELQGLRDQVMNLHEYQDGIIPTDERVLASIADAGEPKLYYEQLSTAAKIEFWAARWDDDIFMWEFQGVLHFK